MNFSLAFCYKKQYILAISAAMLAACLLSGCHGIPAFNDGAANVFTDHCNSGGLQPVPPDISSVSPPSRYAEATSFPSAGPLHSGGEPSSPDPGHSNAVFSADVPLRPEAEDDFFSDAAFVGNSLMDGFRLFTGLDTCDYYAATSMTVLGMSSTYAVLLGNGSYGTIMQAIAQKQYGKVYIMLGINEIGYDVSYFKELYKKMLDEISALQPDADIYIMSLTPVSAYKSSTSNVFNMERVTAYNKALHELAEEKGCYYLDICAALSDDAGYLPSKVTSDGVHFSTSHYLVWLDYVKTHYIDEQ